jgi:hypothetical protein
MDSLHLGRAFNDSDPIYLLTHQLPKGLNVDDAIFLHKKPEMETTTQPLWEQNYE